MAVQLVSVRPIFFDTVESWADRDFGEDLRTFLADISFVDLVSYAQLIYHKNAIVSSLLHHLADRTLSLPAFFDFCSALATDLRDDFQPHFWPIFDAISNLFLTPGQQQRFEDIEVESAFRAMGQIVRTNFKFVSLQLKQLFSRLLLLLGFPSDDDRLRSLSARTFSFVFLKVPSPYKLTKFLLSKCFSGRAHLRDGLSLFFFNSLLNAAGENEAKLGELIDAIIVPIFEMPSNSELECFCVSFLIDVFQKCISREHRSVAAGIITQLLNRFENVQNSNQLQILCQWLLLWINAKRHCPFTEENSNNLLCLIVAKVECPLPSADRAALSDHFLQLICALSLSLAPSALSPHHQASIVAVFSKFGNDSLRLPALLRCLVRLRSLHFFPSLMDLVDHFGASLLASVSTDFANVSQQQLQLLRELLIFYKNIFTLSPFLQNPPFYERPHFSIRLFVVHILQNPSICPSDFFDLSLTIWPHLWLINEKPEGFDALNAFVVQTVRKGTKRMLTAEEAERLWNATNAMTMRQKLTSSETSAAEALLATE